MTQRGKQAQAQQTVLNDSGFPRPLNLRILPNREELGRAAAEEAAAILRDAIARQGYARFITATGASQFDFLAALASRRDVDWSKTELFQLDEYIGIPPAHPASFRRYLLERLVRPTGLARFHQLDGEADPEKVCREMGALLRSAPVDAAFVGIGENGHLAFNDPPADFGNEEPYMVVQLDEACRRQQLGEGWFPRLEDVPQRAISMSIRQILKAEKILCIVPEARKAKAVRACLAGDISPLVPASALRWHVDVKFFLEPASAALLPGK